MTLSTAIRNQQDVSWSLAQDLQAILASAADTIEQLRGARIFITGGTGFIGCWLLETLRLANRACDLKISAAILTRNPQAFAQKYPHLAQHQGFDFIAGNVKDFAFPDGAFTHMIHAATDASADLNINNPRLMFDTVLQGTRRALDFAVDKNITRVLYLSSGAVYGTQPWEITNVCEDYRGSADCTNPVNAYAEGKRAAEMLCAIYFRQFGLAITTARIFALLGPYLSLDIHYAAGNFIRDAMSGRKIVIKGNGSPVRSYLYASDLTTMLWHLLVRGTAGKAYNVGSDEGISIRDLAATVVGVIGGPGYEILGLEDKGWNLGRYVPDTSLIGRELGLFRSVSLEDAIRRTALWHGWKQ